MLRVTGAGNTSSSWPWNWTGILGFLSWLAGKVCTDKGTCIKLPRVLDSENSKILPSLSEEGGEMYRFDRMVEELEVEQSVDPSDLLRSASTNEFRRGRFAVPLENVAVNLRVELVVGKVLNEVTTVAGV